MVSLDLIFRSIFCTFLSIVFVGSLFSFWNWVVLRMSKHFFVYFLLSKITTPLPLSALRMTISFRFDNSFTIFVCLYGTFIFAYLSQVLSSFVLFVVILSQECLKYFSVSFGKTARIQGKFCLYLCYLEYAYPVYMIRQYILHVTKHKMKSCV